MCEADYLNKPERTSSCKSITGEEINDVIMNLKSFSQDQKRSNILTVMRTHEFSGFKPSKLSLFSEKEVNKIDFHDQIRSVISNTYIDNSEAQLNLSVISLLGQR